MIRAGMLVFADGIPRMREYLLVRVIIRVAEESLPL